jgi:predicted phage terminase large subunit-like protein
MAAMELLKRRKARTSLIGFTEYTLSHYQAASHHHKIADALERVERGEIDRLMITMPPRHGKSELASRRFPAWFMGRNPLKNIISASYNIDLAMDFGREVRNIVASSEYENVFKTVLAQDSKAANRWHTESGGAYVAAGVGTSITGRGANVLLIDDPLKDREEADSELRRQRVWDWYTSTAYTRLAPNGAIVLIQTRWHENDLAGRLIEAQENGGDKWELLSLPAIDTQGMALWPDFYDIPALNRIRDAIGSRDWSALYQQSPAPDDGNFFKREWFQYYDAIPANVHRYGASDYAVTDGGGDFTVHIVAAVDSDGNVYIEDIWRGQTTPDVWIERVLDLMKAHEPMAWGEEQGQIIKSIGPFLDRRANERKIYCNRVPMASASDKPTRARTMQARMASGKVLFPKNKPWMAAFEQEMLSFPAGKNDDQVDAASLLFRLLADMIAKDIIPEKAKGDSWDRAFDDDGDDAVSWKTV